MRIGGGGTVGLVLAAVVAGLVVDRAVPGAHVAVGLGLAACLVVIARAGGADGGRSRAGPVDLAAGAAVRSGRGDAGGGGVRPGIPGYSGAAGIAG
jgi:hypothetical protein